MNNYRCPVHTERPVTWRGTGCQQCAAEHAVRTKPRNRGTAHHRTRTPLEDLVPDLIRKDA